MQVDVVLISYNQEQYIAQALESILMQRVNDDVQVRVIVADDCSKDKTLEIIKSYEEKSPFPFVYLQNSYNLGMVDNYRRVLTTIEADFFTILEGDDYWLDTHKLQKQLDTMSQNSNCGLCYADCSILNESVMTHADGLYYSLQRTINTTNPLLETHYQSNVTWMIRGDMKKYFVIPDGCTDIPLIFMYECCLHSEVIFIPQVFGVFRVHLGSVSNQRQNTYSKYLYQRNVFMLCDSYVDKFPNTEEVRKKLYTDALFQLYMQAIQYADDKFITMLKTHIQGLDWDNVEQHLKEISAMSTDINHIRSTHAYKLGKFILIPLKKLKQLFKL